MAVAVGLLVAVAWYYTIICGFYVLYCPIVYLMFFNHKLYRRIADVLFALWELYPVALFQCFNYTELHHFGDYVDPDENTILLVNHRTRLDWNYLWIALYHATQDPNSGNHCICRERLKADISCGPGGGVLDLGGRAKLKIVLKDEIKYGPGLGWIMQLNHFLFVKRSRQEDQVNVSQFVDYYKKLRYSCRLVLFPEGTDMTDDNRRKSDNFAAANNLPRYEFVLHPRTTGWALLCTKLRAAGLVSVYDVTLAYDKPAQNEVDLLKGSLPENVYFFFKRYAIEQLPTEEAKLRSWLNERWLQKEHCLRRFHADGSFIDSATNKPALHRHPRSTLVAKLAFIFWTFIDVIFSFALMNSVVFQFWVFYNTLLFIFVTSYFGGFHILQRNILDEIDKNK